MSRFVAKDYPTSHVQRRWGVWDRWYDAWVRSELGSVRKFSSQRGAKTVALRLSSDSTFEHLSGASDSFPDRHAAAVPAAILQSRTAYSLKEQRPF